MRTLALGTQHLFQVYYYLTDYHRCQSASDDDDTNSHPEMAQAPAVQVVYSPERARDMVVETHADLLALSAAVDDDWASSAQTPDAARAGLDALIARHEKLPTFQIAWHLVSDIDAAATKV